MAHIGKNPIWNTFTKIKIMRYNNGDIVFNNHKQIMIKLYNIVIHKKYQRDRADIMILMHPTKAFVGKGPSNYPIGSLLLEDGWEKL